MIQFPDVEVKLIGESSNIFMLLGITTRALRKAGHHQAADSLAGDVMNSGSYDEALNLIASTVTVV